MSAKKKPASPAQLRASTIKIKKDMTLEDIGHMIESRESKAPPIIQGTMLAAVQTSVAQLDELDFFLTTPDKLLCHKDDLCRLSLTIRGLLISIQQTKSRSIALSMAYSAASLAEEIAQWVCEGHINAVESNMSLVASLLERETKRAEQTKSKAA